MGYQYVAASEAAFVQQLAVGYVNHGYWFYVTGNIPEHKDVTKIDEKLIERYGVAISKWARLRRKRQGLANVQYLRYNRFFVLIATRGLHPFFNCEGCNVKDIRREPIHFAGYSIGYRMGVDRKWHASVRIQPVEYNNLKCYFLDLAICRSAEELFWEFREVPFEPYAPVRRQLFNILRAVNRARKTAGCELIPFSAIPLQRSSVKAFDNSDDIVLQQPVQRNRSRWVYSGCKLSMKAFEDGSHPVETRR